MLLACPVKAVCGVAKIGKLAIVGVLKGSLILVVFYGLL
jgi:hypothetical protein